MARPMIEKKEVSIDVGSEFTPFPAGRHREDGRYSGQAFRENVLLGSLSDGLIVTVYLDSAVGYGSSFLEEAFGGLIRSHELTFHQLKKQLNLKSTDKYLIEEIWGYIEDAAQTELELTSVGG